MFKCELLIGGQTYDVTNDLKNWDDFELLQKRAAYDGVVRSFSTQFEFVKKAYKLLKNEFYTNYLNAEAIVIFSLRNNSWEYDEVFRCALDFSTYSEDGLIASINAIDNTLAAIIKAKKNIQYEYPVTDFYIRNLKYNGIKLSYGCYYAFGGITLEDDPNTMYIEFSRTTDNDHAISLLPLYLKGNGELPNSGSPLTFKDITMGEKGTFFAEALSNVDISVNLDFIFYLDWYKIDYANIRLYVKHTNETYSEIGNWRCNPEERKVVKDTIKTSLQSGDKVGMDINVVYNSPYAPIKVYFTNFSLGVNFSYASEDVNIDVISPIELLDKLLASMSETTDTYYGVIDDYDPRMSLDRLSTVYIMAAESARGLPKAKIYTSYKKYCDWMEAEFGYVPVISGNEVTFIHRDKLFTNTVVKELGKRINDYELTVNDGLVYSSVKVGYDKQDYDSINGRDEFRFTNEFSTGLKLLDNTLSLISPYRADAYGIEFLVQKRGEDTTDSDSDNDVFFVSCDQDGVNLKLYRPYSAAQLSGLLSPETMFNIQYSPRFMLEANKKYIGACTNLLKFASSDGNSDVSINGVKETDDFPIPERLFTVSEVEVSTSDIKAPSDLTGLVSFNNKGEIITGYIKELELNIAKEKAATYTLIVKDIKS